MSITIEVKGAVASGKTTFIREMMAAMPDRDFLIVDDRDSKQAVKLWSDTHPYGVLILEER